MKCYYKMQAVSVSFDNYMFFGIIKKLKNFRSSWWERENIHRRSVQPCVFEPTSKTIWAYCNGLIPSRLFHTITLWVLSSCTSFFFLSAPKKPI